MLVANSKANQCSCRSISTRCESVSMRFAVFVRVEKIHTLILELACSQLDQVSRYSKKDSIYAGL